MVAVPVVGCVRGWIMNDELDPVEETRAIREKIMRKYKTTDAYFEHLKTIPTAEVLLAQVREKNEKAKAARFCGHEMNCD